MRRFFLVPFSFMGLAMATNLVLFAAVAAPAKEMSVVSIPDQTRLLKTVLQGKYIFVHDDEKMAQGGPCFFVYEYSQDQEGNPKTSPEKLVVSFHCQPVAREKADHLVLTIGMAGVFFELREIQFAGSFEGHRVP